METAMNDLFPGIYTSNAIINQFRKKLDPLSNKNDRESVASESVVIL